MLPSRPLLQLPLAVLAMALVVATLAAAQGEAADEGPQTHVVTIKEYEFSPRELTIKVGDTVSFVNEGREDHYIMDADEAYEGDVKVGRRMDVKYSEAGDYSTFCWDHAGVYSGRVVGLENVVIHVRLHDDTGANDPPVVSIRRPANQTVVWGEATIEGFVRDADGPQDLKRVALRIDGGPWTDLRSGYVYESEYRFQYRLDTTKLEPGPHLIEVRAMDRGKAVRTDRITVFVPEERPTTGAYGNARPTITIDAPTEGAVLSTRSVVRGVAADTDSGVILVELRLDGGPWRKANGTGVWHYPIDPARLKTGDHVLQVRAFDSIDHSDVATVRFKVEATPTEAIKPTADATPPKKDTPGVGPLLVLGVVTIAGLGRRRR